MSAATFFIGLTIVASTKADSVLKVLLIVHGVFAPVCVLLPLSDVFGSMSQGEGARTGVTVVLFWCVYFTPVGFLLIWHFAMRPTPSEGPLPDRGGVGGRNRETPAIAKQGGIVLSPSSR